MARARNIKPGFFENEDLAECSPWARLCFAGLWLLADREGRLEDRPKRIKGKLFPFDTVEVEPLLQELERHGFIVRYETDGVKAIQVSEFAKHQSPHYSEKASFIKPPSLPDHSGKSAVIKRGSQPPDSLNPDSLIPSSLIPSSLNPDSPTALPASPPTATKLGSTPTPRRAPREKAEVKTSLTWNAYSTAYRDRYGVDPVRNAKVNAQLSQFVDRLGVEDAPLVAAWYVAHNAAWYVTKGHTVAALLADAEKLRTEWASGRRTTQTQARQADRKQHHLGIAEQLIAENRVKEEAHGQ